MFRVLQRIGSNTVPAPSRACVSLFSTLEIPCSTFSIPESWSFKHGSPNAQLRHFSMMQHRRSPTELQYLDTQYNNALLTWLKDFRPKVVAKEVPGTSQLSDAEFLVVATKQVEKVYLYGCQQRSGQQVTHQKEASKYNVPQLLVETSARKTLAQGTYSVHKRGGKRTAYTTRKNQSNRLLDKDGQIYREDAMNPRLSVYMPHITHHTVLDNISTRNNSLPTTIGCNIGDIDLQTKYGEIAALKITIYSHPLHTLCAQLPLISTQDTSIYNSYIYNSNPNGIQEHEHIKVKRGVFDFIQNNNNSNINQSSKYLAYVQGLPGSSQLDIVKYVIQHELQHSLQHIYAPTTWNTLLARPRIGLNLIRGSTSRKMEESAWIQYVDQSDQTNDKKINRIYTGNTMPYRDPVQRNKFQLRSYANTTSKQMDLLHDMYGIKKNSINDELNETTNQHTKTYLGISKNGHSAFFAMYAVGQFGHQSYTYQRQKT